MRSNSAATAGPNHAPSYGTAIGTLTPSAAQAIDEAWDHMRRVPGYLSESEGRFLALVAAATPAEGAILEIGSFKGKSTIGLASVARRLELAPVIAVDPHTAPAVTDPDLGSELTSYDHFVAVLEAAGLREYVEVHRTLSRDLARTWRRPIRVLWIDGDHTYAGAKEDFELFRAFLADGSVIAIHDVLHQYEGPIRVFAEDVLGSDDFGPAGFVGSIGWAQFRPRDGARFRARRYRHLRYARRLIPLFAMERPLLGLRLHRYRLWKMLLPHGGMDPRRWLSEVLEGSRAVNPQGITR